CRALRHERAQTQKVVAAWHFSIALVCRLADRGAGHVPTRFQLLYQRKKTRPFPNGGMSGRRAMNKKIKTNKKIKEPLDGQPPKGAKASIKDFDYKVLFICRTSRSDCSQDGTFARTYSKELD